MVPELRTEDGRLPVFNKVNWKGRAGEMMKEGGNQKT